jgi:hypothetical protein
MFGKRYSLETLARRGYRLVQRGAARGLDFTAEPTSLRRGDAVQVTLAGQAKGDSVQAGLVCTETYATFMPQSRAAGSDRLMLEGTAYEEWVPVGDGGNVALTVPSDAPYSYDGKQLKLVWRVAVRARRRGVDAMRTRELEVLP